MSSSKALTLALLFLCPLRATADFRASCDQFVNAFADPLVDAGARSAHLHSIGGSLGFSPDRIDENRMREGVSTCDVKGDNSVYWAPTLYVHKDGQKIPLLAHFQAYYEADEFDTSHADAAILAHPLAMIVGNADGGASPEDMARYVRFVCATRVGNSSHFDRTFSLVAGFHPAATCDQVRIDYMFPSCWNGQPYAADQSHVAYPDKKNDDRTCPPTHPRRFAQLRLNHRVELPERMSWSPETGGPPFSLSSGDITTAHADVILLWDTSVLAKVQNECGRRDFSDCPFNGVAMRSDREIELAMNEYVVPSLFV
ncbi:unnamed protein product [Phaeothamnion confervicola]